MIILKSTDFKGKFALSSGNYNSVQIDEYIERYEREYIYKILGKELGDLFIADLNIVTHIPDTPIYLTIFNYLVFEEENCWNNIFWEWDGYWGWDFCGNFQIISKGLKEILVACVYFHACADGTVKQSITGAVINQNENSNVLSPINNLRFAESKFNEQLESVKTIQYYILKNKIDYPTFKGIKFEQKYSSML